ncbi:FMN-binding negative transcriptional regulator [Alishewanella longhuensis]
MLYCPPKLAFTDSAALYDFIEHYSFGCLISTPSFCSHLPWLLQRDEAEQGVLYGRPCPAKSALAANIATAGTDYL